MAYANDAKQTLLRVPDSVFDKGAVAADVAGAMASKMRPLLSADIGIRIQASLALVAVLRPNQWACFTSQYRPAMAMK